MTAQPRRTEQAQPGEPVHVDPEAKVGEVLWQAVDDPAWAPTDEYLGYMARAARSVEAVAALLDKLCARGRPIHEQWTQGREDLVAESLDQLDALLAGLAHRPDLVSMVRYSAARHGVVAPEAIESSLLETAASWFVAPGPEVDPRDPEAWWEGFDRVWSPELWWGAVARQAADLSRPVSPAVRLRPCLSYAGAAEQAVIAVRLFDASPRWAAERLESLGAEAWDPLMDLAELIVASPEVKPDGHRSWSELSSGVAVGLAQISVRLDRGLEPTFFAKLIGAAMDANRHPDAVGPINRALGVLPVNQRQRLMLSAPYLRWRYLPACPTQVVVDWAVGEVSKLSPRTFGQLSKAFPEGAFHFGENIDDLRSIAADALGEAGAPALPFLVDGLTRATDANKAVFARALGAMRSAEAMAPLLHALAHGTSAVRRVICEGLAGFGDDLLPELAPLLRDPQRPVRAAAASVLAEMEPSGDVRGLAASALPDEDASEIRAVLKGIVDAPTRPRELGELERKERGLDAARRRSLLDGLRASEGRAWREHLDLGVVVVAFLADWHALELAEGRTAGAAAWYDALLHFVEDPGLPWAAARLADNARFSHEWLAEVAEVVGRRIAGPLNNRLAGASGERRRVLLRAMAQYCPKDGVRDFMRGIASGDPELRRVCHDGLRDAGEAALVPLREALASDDPRLQQQAARVLERLPDPRNVPALRACLSALHDPRAAWVVQRAIVVSQTDATPEDDRELDRMLGRQPAAGSPPFVVEMGLPKLRYVSGQLMSNDTRSWFVSALFMAGQKVDWFLPLSNTARLIWAIRNRLDVRSAQDFLDELVRQARTGLPAEAEPFLTVATAVLAPDEQIEEMIARIGAADWADAVLDRKRVTFPEGDPRLLFLRGTPACLRAVIGWAQRSHSPLLTSWSRLHLAKLHEAVGVGVAQLTGAVADPTVEPVEEICRRYEDRLRTGATFSFETLLADARGGLGGAVLRGLVFDSLAADSSVAARFRWAGTAATDVEGEPVVVGARVRVSDPSAWRPVDLARWRKVFPECTQPIEQLWPTRSGLDPKAESKAGTGWQPGVLLLRAGSQLGYGHNLDDQPLPGGRRRYPPGTVGVLAKVVRDLWEIRLHHTPLEAWSGAETAPVRLRVVGATFARREPLAGSPWREASGREVPAWLKEQLAEDLAGLDRGAAPYVPAANEAVVEVEAEAEDVDAALDAEEAEADAAERKAAEQAKAASGGLLGWMFGRRQAAEEEAAKKEAEERRERARQRRETARKLAEENRRAAEAKRVLDRQQQQVKAHAQSKRWTSVEAHLVAARQAREARLEHRETSRRLQRRSALLEAEGASRAESIVGKAFLRDLAHRRAEVVGVAVAATRSRAVPLRAVETIKPERNTVTVATEFLDLVGVERESRPAEAQPTPPPAEVVAEPVAEERNERVEALRAAARKKVEDARLMAERARRTAEARRSARERLAEKRAQVVEARAELSASERAAEARREIVAEASRAELAEVARAATKEVTDADLTLRWLQAATTARERGQAEAAKRAEEVRLTALRAASQAETVTEQAEAVEGPDEQAAAPGGDLTFVVDFGDEDQPESAAAPAPLLAETAPAPVAAEAWTVEEEVAAPDASSLPAERAAQTVAAASTLREAAPAPVEVLGFLDIDDLVPAASPPVKPLPAPSEPKPPVARVVSPAPAEPTPVRVQVVEAPALSLEPPDDDIFLSAVEPAPIAAPEVAEVKPVAAPVEELRSRAELMRAHARERARETKERALVLRAVLAEQRALGTAWSLQVPALVDERHLAEHAVRSERTARVTAQPQGERADTLWIDSSELAEIGFADEIAAGHALLAESIDAAEATRVAVEAEAARGEPADPHPSLEVRVDDAPQDALNLGQTVEEAGAVAGAGWLDEPLSEVDGGPSRAGDAAGASEAQSAGGAGAEHGWTEWSAPSVDPIAHGEWYDDVESAEPAESTAWLEPEPGSVGADAVGDDVVGEVGGSGWIDAAESAPVGRGDWYDDEPAESSAGSEPEPGSVGADEVGEDEVGEVGASGWNDAPELAPVERGDWYDDEPAESPAGLEPEPGSVGADEVGEDEVGEDEVGDTEVGEVGASGWIDAPESAPVGRGDWYDDEPGAAPDAFDGLANGTADGPAPALVAHRDGYDDDVDGDSFTDTEARSGFEVSEPSVSADGGSSEPSASSPEVVAAADFDDLRAWMREARPPSAPRTSTLTDAFLDEDLVEAYTDDGEPFERLYETGEVPLSSAMDGDALVVDVGEAVEGSRSAQASTQGENDLLPALDTEDLAPFDAEDELPALHTEDLAPLTAEEELPALNTEDFELLTASARYDDDDEPEEPTQILQAPVSRVAPGARDGASAIELADEEGPQLGHASDVAMEQLLSHYASVLDAVPDEIDDETEEETVVGVPSRLLSVRRTPPPSNETVVLDDESDEGANPEPNGGWDEEEATYVGPLGVVLLSSEEQLDNDTTQVTKLSDLMERYGMERTVPNLGKPPSWNEVRGARHERTSSRAVAERTAPGGDEHTVSSFDRTAPGGDEHTVAALERTDNAMTWQIGPAGEEHTPTESAAVVQVEVTEERLREATRAPAAPAVAAPAQEGGWLGRLFGFGKKKP